MDEPSRTKTELMKGQSVYSEFEGFGETASDYDIRVENQEVRRRRSHSGR